MKKLWSILRMKKVSALKQGRYSNGSSAWRRYALRWRACFPARNSASLRQTRKRGCAPVPPEFSIALPVWRRSCVRHLAGRRQQVESGATPVAVLIQNREEFEQRLVIMKPQDGWSIRALARHFAVSRNMVRRILRKHEKLRDQGHDILLADRQVRKTERASKLDSYEETLKRLLEKYPRITGQRLFEELCDAGYNGGISILRDRLRRLRPSPKKTPVIRFETGPGLQGQMDWSPYTIKFLKTGKATVQCFSYILGFSRRHFVDFTPRRGFFSPICPPAGAFSPFSGAPAQCLYDSEKTVVLRWEAGRPVINPAFSALITHYRCRPIICRRGRAETKGKIERPFQYVEGNLLCGREFQDLDDLRACARWWMRGTRDT